MMLKLDPVPSDPFVPQRIDVVVIGGEIAAVESAPIVDPKPFRLERFTDGLPIVIH